MTDDTEVFEFTGPERAGWYRTQMPDWIALHPDLTHTAYRLFAVVRQLILEKQPAKVRLLTNDELAFLLPGKNGKPTSADVVKDALRNLEKVGLMSNPDGKRIVTSTGRGGIQSKRRFQLHDWPQDPASYTGWRNAFDKLDAYTPDWRTTRTDVCPGKDDGGKKPARTDQGEHASESEPATDTTSSSPAQTDDSAGQFDGGKKPSPGGKKPSRGGKKPATSGLTCENTDSLKDVPQGSSSSSGVTPDTGPSGGPGLEDEEDPPENTDQQPEPSVLGIVTGATDATAEEAQALVEALRPEATKSLTGYVKKLAATGDLGHRLWRMRRDAEAAQAPPQPRPGEGATCSEHGQVLPCLACRMDVMGGDTDVVERLLAEHGPQARPDLARMLQTAGGVR